MKSCTQIKTLAILLLLSGLWVAPLGAQAIEAPIIQGRVEDGSGNPIHEAEIEALVAGQTKSLVRILSDHSGRFAFSGLPAGDIELIAPKAGLQPVSTVVIGSERWRQVVIVLSEFLPQVDTKISVFGAAPRTATSSSTFRQEQFANLAVEDTAQILRVIPGLVVVQHAGGGKSNQYLIRGFDADHGTDLALSFAGIPVNMVSHAHGQGYADLNFVIPETLQSIDVYKGPYFAELGNLATGGAANLELREQFDRSFVKLQGGQFGTGRLVFGFSPKVDWTRGFVAVENRYANGPFRDAQHFNRFNFATRWLFDLAPDQEISVLGTAYRGTWNASGQIPLREVRAGRLDRFGSIDNSEGGDSSRYNFGLTHKKLWGIQALESQFYVVRNRLELFSNFTFFARDPVHGDGILQSDDRSIAGGRVQYHLHNNLGPIPSLFTAGLDSRHDFADVALLRQNRRTVLGTSARSHINERNVALYAQAELQLHATLKAIVGLRHDRFRFLLDDAGPRSAELYRHFTGPKASLVYSPRRDKGPEFYANYGRGFHSNDARSIAENPASRALAAANGYELGYRQVFAGRLELSAAYWLLDLAGELVWQGDEGTTELRGPTRRQGPEIEVKWKINDRLWTNASASYSRGHYRNSKDLIARAPRLTVDGGISLSVGAGASGDIQIRHVGSHPLLEDNSVRADAYTAVDLNLRKSFSDHWEGLLTVENLFNSKIKEAQTFFESRLRFEPVPVGDNHFNPGYPLTLRLGIQYRF